MARSNRLSALDAACLVMALLAAVLPRAVAADTPAAAPAPAPAAAAALGDTAALAAGSLPVVQFPAGARLHDLPGAAVLHPKGLVTEIRNQHLHDPSGGGGAHRQQRRHAALHQLALP